MKKIITVVVLRKSNLGTFISFVKSDISSEYEEIDSEKRSALQTKAEDHIEECINSFPEFSNATFEISFHESKIYKD